MGHSHHGHHGHHHHHHHHGEAHGNLLLALALNAGFAVIELLGGLWTGSVAILSDAVHDLGDSLALGSAWYLERKAEKRSDRKFSYGYRRMSLLSALLTGTFLLGGSIWVLSEAIPRLFNPVTPKVEGMVGFALLGIAVNGYAAWRVQKGTTMNERMVSWHLMEDVFGWVAVLISAIIMAIFDWPIIDPLLSIGFTAFIIWGVFRNLRSTVSVFLQGVPEDVDIDLIREDLGGIEGVMGLHDVHMWSLDGATHVVTVHVVVGSDTTLVRSEEIKNEVRMRLQKRGKFHATIEIESEKTVCAEVNCAN